MSLGTIPVRAADIQDGTRISVDQWSRHPEVIARKVADISQKKFIASAIFDISGMTTPTVAVELPDTVDNDVYPTKNPQIVEPLSPTPLADMVRGTLTTFVPKKWQLGYELSQEAIDDNDITQMQKVPRVLANGFTRTLNIVATEVIEKAVTDYSRTVSATTTWTAINALTYDTKTASSTVLDVFGKARLQVENEERGYEDAFDTLLVNGAQAYAIELSLGANWRQSLSAQGITNVIVSPRVTDGTAYFLASGLVGAMRFRDPLTVRRIEQEEIDGVLLKGSTRFVAYVNEPYAVVKLTNLA
jgi:hypothetical protein